MANARRLEYRGTAVTVVRSLLLFVQGEGHGSEVRRGGWLEADLVLRLHRRAVLIEYVGQGTEDLHADGGLHGNGDLVGAPGGVAGDVAGMAEQCIGPLTRS